MRLNRNRIKELLAVLALVALLAARPLLADSVDDLRAKIAENNQKILELQKQIDQYSSLYNSTSKQAQTLKNALAALEANRKKLEAQLAQTAAKITKTTLTLQELGDTIEETEGKIETSSKAVAEGIRLIDEAENRSLIQEFLNQRTLSEAWDYVSSIRAVQTQVSAGLADLQSLHESLTDQKAEAERQRESLVSLQKDLSGQKTAIQATADEKSRLLTQTQSDAAKYQAQLAAATAQKAQFEKELFDYESKLKIAIDPNAIPSARSGVLSWPLSDVTITQYFGKTVDARRLYVSGTHGGIDLRAAIGTPVMAALSGVVTDTEAVKYKAGCQYGKFVLIKHANGLSTIYGHLSAVYVKPGDTVVTGDTIGLSGSTGYATGPHLHLGVYATQGIRIVDSKDLGSTSCKGIKTVAAPPSAYLDPLAYLPTP